MKTLLCDMTGVVFTNGKPNIKLLQTLSNTKKVNVSFCTGKSYLGMCECLEKFDFKGPMVCENGALITFLDGTIISKHSIQTRTIEGLVHDIMAQGVQSISFCNLKTYRHIFWLNNNSISLPDYFYAEYITHNEENFLEKMLEQEIVRLVVHTTQKVEIEKYKEYFEVNLSADGFYSITAKGINKKSAAYEISSYLNISVDDLIIIGNDYNDIDVFDISEAMKISIGASCPMELINKSDLNLELDEFDEWLGLWNL